MKTLRHIISHIQIASMSPSNHKSIPKLELKGAFLLAKLISQVEFLPFIEESTIYCLSDSLIVLHWIH